MDGRVEASETTEDESQIRLWMTSLQKLPLFSTREYGTEPRILRPRPCDGAPDQRVDALALGSGVSGVTKFTFLR